MRKLTGYVVNKYQKERNRELQKCLFDVLRENVNKEKAKKQKIVRCMLTLRKFHTFIFFHRYRRIVHWETQIKSKDSI